MATSPSSVPYVERAVNRQPGFRPKDSQNIEIDTPSNLQNMTLKHQKPYKNTSAGVLAVVLLAAVTAVVTTVAAATAVAAIAAVDFKLEN